LESGDNVSAIPGDRVGRTSEVEIEGYFLLLDELLASDAGRKAWLLGFVTGHAVAERALSGDAGRLAVVHDKNDDEVSEET
jgi:hypothetical protein